MTSDELKLAAEYNRGWQDSKKAKSADEWRLARDREDVVRKLLDVKLDGGGHEKLSEICKCVYHTDEWTPSAHVGLRDELVRLLGGDDASSCPLLTTYDMLDNERHKAVCELRKLNFDFGGLLTNNQICIADAIGTEFNEGDNFSKAMCDRLIHLLGGDNGTMGQSDGTCPNNVPTLSNDTEQETITSELRDALRGYEDNYSLIIEKRRLIEFADHIDAQFARICEQQESVLQATIGQMCEERDKLQAAIDLKDRALDAALAKLKDSVVLPKDRDGVTWNFGDRFAHKGKTYEVSAMRLFETGKWGLETSTRDGNFNPIAFTHFHAPTAESIVRDLTLGLITEKEAVKRIEELRNE